MRRIDALAITVMVMMTIVWFPGCPRNDLSDQGQTVTIPEPVQEPAESAPAEVAPPDATPEATADATAEASTTETPPADTPVKPATPTPVTQPKPAEGGASSAAAPSATASSPSSEPAEPAAQAAPTPSPEPAEPAAQAASTQEQAAPAADEDTVVIGRVSLVSHVPEASEVPYTECLVMVKYTVESVESGSYDDSELLAAFWGMRKGELQPAAKFRVGQRHRLVIEPLTNHPELQRVMQADDTNEYSLTPQWVIHYSAL